MKTLISKIEKKLTGSYFQSNLFAHSKLANVDYKYGILLGIGGIVGAQIGARLVEQISTDNFLKKIFSVTLVGFAIYLFVKK